MTTDTVTIHDQNKRCKLNPELEESVCERAVKSAMNRLVEMKIYKNFFLKKLLVEKTVPFNPTPWRLLILSPYILLSTNVVFN